MSGILNAYSGGTYSGLPDAPTIGTATATSYSTATVAFTAPTNTGGLPITGYQALSSPGSITATGASSPITVTGLSGSTTYTFTVRAQNAIGYGAYSGASNSITTSLAPGSQAFTTVGTFTWVAPAGVTSVSAVGVGGSSSGQGTSQSTRAGGTLAYINSYGTSPGSSYSVVVGSAYAGNLGGASTFGSMVATGGGNNYNGRPYPAGCDYNYGGGCSGASAGGYAYCFYHSSNGSYGSGGAGGSGGSGGQAYPMCCGGCVVYGAGGGTGIYGQGANGGGGGQIFCVCNKNSRYLAPGGGGSGGTSGGATYSYPTVTSGVGGSYGGVPGRGSLYANYVAGGQGAVRIVWPGTTRTFPSTCVGSP
jgi:hypothetical protein